MLPSGLRFVLHSCSRALLSDMHWTSQVLWTSQVPWTSQVRGLFTACSDCTPFPPALIRALYARVGGPSFFIENIKHDALLLLQ